MNTFLLNKTQYYIDRPDQYLALFKYITGDHKDFTLIKDKLGTELDKANNQPLMALSSQEGDGKTMLLAKFVLDIQVNSFKTYLKSQLDLPKGSVHIFIIDLTLCIIKTWSEPFGKVRTHKLFYRKK
jgi:hypothetical protein